MTLRIGKTDMRLTPQHWFKNVSFPRGVIRIVHLHILFELNKTARKSRKDVSPLSLLA